MLSIINQDVNRSFNVILHSLDALAYTLALLRQTYITFVNVVKNAKDSVIEPNISKANYNDLLLRSLLNKLPRLLVNNLSFLIIEVTISINLMIERGKKGFIKLPRLEALFKIINLSKTFKSNLS